MRLMASQVPLKAPHSLMASIAYLEHVGWYRQLEPMSGEIAIR